MKQISFLITSWHNDIIKLINWCVLRRNVSRLLTFIGSRYVLFLYFRSFGSVSRSTLFSTINTTTVIYSSYDMVSHTWKILYSSSSDHHHTVFLEIVFYSRNICKYFSTITKSHLSNFTLSWVRFLRFHDGNLETYTSFEWSRNLYFFVHFQFVQTKLKRRRFRFVLLLRSTCLDELIDSRHITKKLAINFWITLTIVAIYNKKSSQNLSNYLPFLIVLWVRWSFQVLLFMFIIVAGRWLC